MNFKNKILEEHWKNLLDDSQLCYNDISNILWDNPDIKIGLKSVHASCYNIMREKYTNLPSQMIIKIYKAVISSYISNKRKFKCVKTQSSCQLDKRLYSNLTPTSIKLNSEQLHHKEVVDFKLYKKFNELASQYPMHYPNMFIRNNEIYLGIPFNIQAKPIVKETYIGVDLGVKRLVVTSIGDVIDNKPMKAIKRKIRKLKRQLQSKKSYAAKKHLKN